MLKYRSVEEKFFRNEDTGAKVILLKKELKATSAEKQGIFTTGILIKTEAAEITIYLEAVGTRKAKKGGLERGSGGIGWASYLTFGMTGVSSPDLSALWA